MKRRRPGPSSLTPLERGILEAVAYADIFDFPLTIEEAHHYLHGTPAEAADVREALGGASLVPSRLSLTDGLLTLTGRERLTDMRRRRTRVARSLWPIALRYGEMIGRLPFVRMVAVTGALAVGNVEPDSDIDYLVVTEPGRLWTSRAFVIAIVRAAAARGQRLCPNYFLSLRSLELADRTVFTAHELAQMIPVAGFATYHAIRAANDWTRDFLPNAMGDPRSAGWPGPHENGRRPVAARLGGLAEVGLGTRAGGRLERWEMDRKVRRFSSQSADHGEAAFSADLCKGHFDGHGQRVMAAFEGRMARIEGGAA